MRKLNVEAFITYPVTQPVSADWDSKLGFPAVHRLLKQGLGEARTPQEAFLLPALKRYQYNQLAHVWLIFLKLGPALLNSCVARGMEQQKRRLLDGMI